MSSEQTADRLCIFERASESTPGGVERTWLVRAPLSLVVGDRAPLALPVGAVGKVFERYGLPLAEESLELGGAAPPAPGPSAELTLPDGRLLRVQHLSWFDVMERDYLLFYPAHGEPRFELCTSITAALLHLAESYARHSVRQ